MGASSRIYIVPYQPDIKKALQELRDAIFKAGAYYTQSSLLNLIDSMDEADIRKHISAEYFKAFQHAVEALRSEPQPPKPTTIDELIQMNGESGTHSILDIKDISPKPDFGAAAPLEHTRLIELFDTAKPTRSMVEEKIEEILSLRDRWQGTYILIYADDLPVEILFAGYSGD